VVPIFISLLALAISVASTVIGFRRQKTQMQTTVRDQLSDIVQELIKLIRENTEYLSVPPTEQDASFFRRGASIQATLAALARQAGHLIELAREIVFDVEFSVLAQAMEIVGDIPAAERYWKDAVQSSPTDYYRIINTRGYGAFLIRQGQQERGRRLFEEALSIWGNTTDFNKLVNGFTYQFWGENEWGSSPRHGRADECFRNARKRYETISSASLKDQALRRFQGTHPEPLPTSPTIPDLGELRPPRSR
jgi:tetratricopeptide (TPR) repeat protein